METLKALRKKYGYTQKQVANVLGITESAYNHYESGRNQLSIDAINKLADFYDVTADMIIGREKLPELKTVDEFIEDVNLQKEVSPKTVLIPILGRVLAGFNGIAEQEIVGYLDIEEALQKRFPECYALKVSGHSMEPEICDGDTVIIRPCSIVNSGDVAIVCINGDEGTVKRVKIDESGLTVIPANSDYKPITFTPEQVEYLPVRINGQVMQVRHNYF